MKSRLTKSVLVSASLLALLSFAPIFVGVSGYTSYPGCVTTAPTPPAGSHLIVNLKFTAVNDEDSGNYGYWAMDHLNINVKIYSEMDGSWYVVQTYKGQFIVPQGATSPGAGSIESQSAYGTVVGYVAGPFTGTFTDPNGYPFTQHVTYNVDMHGTTADILLGTYGNGQTGGTNSSYFWYNHFFGGPSPGSDPAPYYSLSYTLNSTFKHALSSSMCQSDTNNVQGDILV